MVPLRGIDILPNSSYLGRDTGNPTDVLKDNLSTIEETALMWLRRFRRAQHLNLVEDYDFDENPDTGLLLPRLYPSEALPN